MKIMNYLITLAVVASVLAVCVVGACAALCGFKRIDDFCAEQLND